MNFELQVLDIRILGITKTMAHRNNVNPPNAQGRFLRIIFTTQRDPFMRFPPYKDSVSLMNYDPRPMF